MPVRCAHKGPCGNQAVPECPCFSNNVHCRRNCQCSSQCTRRHKGCRCSNGKSLCGESNHKKTRCKCSKEARECDPEVCRHGRPAIKKGRAANKIPPKCDNYVMQRASPVALAVQSGSYGLGTFTRQNILKGNFVGAYVGEILWSNSGDHQTLEQKFTGYNYMFAHTQSQLLDAKSVGNETRYINHAKPPKANVEARFKLVNGEQKIGFFAIKHIKPGKELLFDYGDNYWRQNE
ncbi:hypothetical protein BC835DRAFT_986116 [Cytidiella melzeri]|nr:hypothetical protein BC835DRAFT_986116 [Cytidiella melzeri]